MMTYQYKDNLVALSNVLNNMDAPQGFNQEKWNSCIGHIAAKNGIGGLTINDRGWPAIGVLGQTPALINVFGNTVVKDIFDNDHYYNYTFNSMVEVVNNYLHNVYNVPLPKKVVKITLDASDINRLYKLIHDAGSSNQQFNTLVIDSDGGYKLSFGDSITSTR